jgi:hypothetical protein
MYIILIVELRLLKSFKRGLKKKKKKKVLREREREREGQNKGTLKRASLRQH